MLFNRFRLNYKCKVIRTTLHLTQKEFAKKIGSNQTEVSFIERGFIPLKKEKIKAINELYKTYKDK